MKISLRLVTMFMLIAAQLSVPAWMIGQREWVLKQGTVYKFRTAPVDPYDPFRGRYVVLSFEQNSAPYRGSELKVPQRLTVYAALEVDEEGFARFAECTRTKPDAGDYIRLQAWYNGADRNVVLELPFDRYYMNELKAPAAERAYNEHSRTQNRDAYVTVRVRNGMAVLEELFVAGLPIQEFLATNAEQP